MGQGTPSDPSCPRNGKTGQLTSTLFILSIAKNPWDRALLLSGFKERIAVMLSILSKAKNQRKATFYRFLLPSEWQDRAVNLNPFFLCIAKNLTIGLSNLSKTKTYPRTPQVQL